MNATVKAWLLLGGIFVVGVVTGSALTFGFGPHFKGPRNEADMPTRMMAYLTRHLDLTDDQRAKIQPILKDTAHQIQDLRRDEVTRGSQIFHGADQKILAILTPEQQVELRKLAQERDNMFANHMMHPGPHAGPGGMPGGPFHRFDQPGDVSPPPPGDQTNAPPPPPPR